VPVTISANPDHRAPVIGVPMLGVSGPVSSE